MPTRLLYEVGDSLLTDELRSSTRFRSGKPFVYDVDSFFQVNIPIFEKALTAIVAQVGEPVSGTVTDMYAGVGSIGLSLAADKVELIELDPATVRMAAHNAASVSENMSVSVIETSAEKALDYITGDNPVIFDPPRAGLHAKVVGRVLETTPDKLIYLSCNPSTQARDLGLLSARYDTTFFEAYNFFPRTPHIETLAVLQRRK